MKYNITKCGFDIGLGGSRLSVNTRDGKLGFGISEHLSMDTSGKLSFRI